MPALRGARSTIGAQDEGTGLRSPPPQKETRGTICGSAVGSGNEKGSPSQEIPDPKPASKEASTEEATEAMTLGDWENAHPSDQLGTVKTSARPALPNHSGEHGRPSGGDRIIELWMLRTGPEIRTKWSLSPGRQRRSPTEFRWSAATDTSRSSGQEWWWWACTCHRMSISSGWAAFKEFLDGVGDCVRRHLPRQVLVLGDFNVHSTEWGNPRTNARGSELSDWATRLGLLLVNRSSARTCVAWRGSSVIDITWASPDAFRWISG